MRVYPDTTPQEEFNTLRSGGYRGCLNDMQYNFLDSEGLTGSLADKLHTRSLSGGVLPPVTVTFLSQSEGAYWSESSAFYTQTPYLTVENDDTFVMYQRDGAGTSADTTTTKTVLTDANKTAVSPSAVVLANFCHHVAPGRVVAFGELSEAGTGRTSWVDDSDTDRIWERSADIVSEIIVDYGYITRACEYWWSNDRSAMPEWLDNMGEVYTGQYKDGSRFELGSTRLNATISPNTVIDHCIYDFETEDPTDLGRGLFARSTPLDIQIRTPSGSDHFGHRSGVDEFINDSRIQSLGGVYGNSPTGYGHDGSHPNPDQEHDMHESMFDMVAPTVLRALGLPAAHSHFTGFEMAGDDSYMDVTFTPGNGGVLRTKREVMGVAEPDPIPDYYQEVVGFEICRAGSFDWFLIMRSGSTGIATEYQGTVERLDDTTVRITPVTPFAAGDRVRYLWGKPFCRSDTGYSYPSFGNRTSDDAECFLNHPIEFVSDYHNADAEYPFSGFPVVSYSDIFVVDQTAPTSYFTVTGSGPNYVAPSDVPANTTRIRYEIQFKLPKTMKSRTGACLMFAIESTGFDLSLAMNAGHSLYVSGLETGNATSIKPAPSSLGSPDLDMWHTLDIYADQVAEELVFAFDGATSTVLPCTGTSTGVFQSSRKISILSNHNGASNVYEGAQIGYIKCWLTTSGTETLLKHITPGNCNDDAWKGGDDATVTGV